MSGRKRCVARAGSSSRLSPQTRPQRRADELDPTSLPSRQACLRTESCLSSSSARGARQGATASSALAGPACRRKSSNAPPSCVALRGARSPRPWNSPQRHLPISSEACRCATACGTASQSSLSAAQRPAFRNVQHPDCCASSRTSPKDPRQVMRWFKRQPASWALSERATPPTLASPGHVGCPRLSLCEGEDARVETTRTRVIAFFISQASALATLPNRFTGSVHAPPFSPSPSLSPLTFVNTCFSCAGWGCSCCRSTRTNPRWRVRSGPPRGTRGPPSC